MLVVGCAFCVQLVQARSLRGDKPYYNFSMLPQQGKLFADEDELDEDELFRAPVKSKFGSRCTDFKLTTAFHFPIFLAEGIKNQPYYDDEREPIVDTEDDSEDEIVMLDKRRAEFCD